MIYVVPLNTINAASIRQRIRAINLLREFLFSITVTSYQSIESMLNCCLVISLSAIS